MGELVREIAAEAGDSQREFGECLGQIVSFLGERKAQRVLDTRMDI